MRVYRAELVAESNLVARLDAVSAEGWTLLSVSLFAGGNEPAFYCLWDRAA